MIFNFAQIGQRHVIISSAELGGIKSEANPTLLSYLVASKELWKFKTNNLVESFNSLLERRFSKFHSPWRILQIARAIALYYNLLTYFLTIIIILQLPSFLSISQKYIQ
ncbi:Partial transposase ISC1250 [Saccharolobus solfataricus P2]|uniref:Partial transposase ISC1250 n=2 Tax=Saccharolobus solfataricus TaxID=2287 RepID=Q97YN8_SACS2|nr:Partial transposase ISC1250 [Saccharolobus solfataricus P2]SAI84935.1 ORF in transposon ISC1250 [Saccharolobus solfataricus]